MAAKKFPIVPAHPERTCWGCDVYCAANAMRCGNGSERTQHPVELWGEDWLNWGEDHGGQPQTDVQTAGAAAPAPAVKLP